MPQTCGIDGVNSYLIFRKKIGEKIFSSLRAILILVLARMSQSPLVKLLGWIPRDIDGFWRKKCQVFQLKVVPFDDFGGKINILVDFPSCLPYLSTSFGPFSVATWS